MSQLRVLGLVGALLLTSAGTGAAQLAPKQVNVNLVDTLVLETPAAFRSVDHPGALAPDQVGDFAYSNGFLFVNSTSAPDCKRGGTFVVDARNPASLAQIGFIPALPGTFHDEGIHVLALNTPAFTGNVIAVNNKPCAANGTGGFDLYDVSNPMTPVLLAQAVGDYTRANAYVLKPNPTHSVFVWEDGDRAYAVIPSACLQATTT